MNKEIQKNLKAQFSKRVPKGFWKDFGNHKLYIMRLGKILGYSKPEDWYKVKHSDFKNNGGAGLLANYYGDSPYNALKTIISDYDFKPWLFKDGPKNLWKNKHNQKDYIDWLAVQLKYKKREDWYKIDKK